MTDKDSITLPREVVDKTLAVLEYGDGPRCECFAGCWECDPANAPNSDEAIQALRTALAAEPQKQEPVAWQERHFFPKVGEWTHWYDCRPRMADYPREQIEQNGVRYQWRPLYAAPPEDAERLTDEQIDSATAKERDALLDHIYEYGTAAEGILERIRKLARAAIDAAMKGDKT